MSYLSCVEIEPQHRHADAAVIWLHGLGADGHDFEPVVPELRLPESMAVRFIFPHAPKIPVTINGGMTMPAWFDIRSMDLDRGLDMDQLLDSSRRISDLISRELDRGIESRHIVVAGFSQGATVAYHTALTYPLPLAGLMALSGFFATPGQTRPHEANCSLPVMLAHGTSDPMVPEQLGRQSVEQLKALGLEPEYHSYPMGHEVCLEEIRDISSFLQQVLAD